jgi:hypothetical protein
MGQLCAPSLLLKSNSNLDARMEIVFARYVVENFLTVQTLQPNRLSSGHLSKALQNSAFHKYH